MPLEGDLEYFPLPEILQLISIGRRSGTLKLKQDEETGELYFIEGVVIHSVCGDLKGEEAAYYLAAWQRGTFYFESETEAAEETMFITAENLMMESARRIDEESRIRELIPSPAMIFKLSSRPKDKFSSIHFKLEEWQVISMINRKRSVSDIVETLKRDEFEVCRILYGLLTAGLIESVQTGEIERELEVITAIGFRFSPDEVGIDEQIISQWRSYDTFSQGITHVQVKTSSERISIYGVRKLKGIGNKIAIPPSLLVQLGVEEGMKVKVRPVRRR